MKRLLELPIRIVKSNVSSVGPSSEREKNPKQNKTKNKLAAVVSRFYLDQHVATVKIILAYRNAL